MLYLLIREEGGEREALIGRELLRIGRLGSNGLHVTSQDVSREHSEIRVAGSGAEVRDLGSINGTFVEASGHATPDAQLPPHEWRRISVGDVVRLGTSCRIELRESHGVHAIREAEPRAEDAGSNISTLVPDHPATRLLQALGGLSGELSAGSPDADKLEKSLAQFVQQVSGVTFALLVVRQGTAVRVRACVMRSESTSTQPPGLHLALAEEALDSAEGLRWIEGEGTADASLACRGDSATVLVLGMGAADGTLPAELVATARVAARLLADAFANASDSPQHSLHGGRSSDQVEGPITPATLFPGVVPSTSFGALLQSAARVAGGSGPILIAGETGVGKELIARFLHAASGRPGPFVEASVGALSPTLVESELFGHVKGAFTDATSHRPGLLEQAHRGTLFLDEIGEVPLEVQHKLLRALQERTYRRVGSNVTEAFNALVVAATNRDLASEVAAGKFREDLFYRLNMMEVRVAPLRERPGDIAILAEKILQELEPSRGIDSRALDWLVRQPWPGNVRQLRNVLERAVRLYDCAVLRPEHLGADTTPPSTMSILQSPLDWREALCEFERAWCEVLWAASGERMAEAARLSGLDRSNVRRRLKAQGLGALASEDDTAG